VTGLLVAVWRVRDEVVRKHAGSGVPLEVPEQSAAQWWGSLYGAEEQVLALRLVVQAQILETGVAAADDDGVPVVPIVG
jgi:hypothetical protein